MLFRAFAVVTIGAVASGCLASALMSSGSNDSPPPQQAPAVRPIPWLEGAQGKPVYTNANWDLVIDAPSSWVDTRPSGELYLNYESSRVLIWFDSGARDEGIRKIQAMAAAAADEDFKAKTGVTPAPAAAPPASQPPTQEQTIAALVKANQNTLSEKGLMPEAATAGPSVLGHTGASFYAVNPQSPQVFRVIVAASPDGRCELNFVFADRSREAVTTLSERFLRRVSTVSKGPAAPAICR